MGRVPVYIHPDALTEAEAATDWYARHSRKAAQAFVTELGYTIHSISEDSSRFPRGEFGTRTALLRKFPYLVVFRQSGAGLQIVAVAHGRRRPGYWRDRA